MTLTSLFALQFADVDSGDVIKNSLQTSLLIGVGVTLDLSKYIFWRYRKQHVGYTLLSIGLVFFSCVASMAFLVTHQKHAEKEAQLTSPEYIAHQLQIEQLRLEIALKEQLAKQRLESRYHDQWDESHRLQSEIKQLHLNLSDLILKSNEVGVHYSKTNTNTSAFFSTVAGAMNAPYSVIVVVSYTILSVFIELCALGLIGINVKNPNNVELHSPTNTENNEGDTTSSRSDDSSETIPVEKKIENDILSGEAKPVVRQLIKKYRINHSSVKKILKNMKNDGYLEKRGNMYFRVN